VLGEDYEEMVSSRGHLGVSYAEMGQYSAAESLWKRCEDVSMKRLGPENTVTLDYTRKLFVVMMEQSAWSRAKEKGESYLKILAREQPGALQTLDITLRLGTVCVNVHEYPKALEYHRRALTGLERSVGFQNIRTIDAQFKLGALYGELGDMKRAEQVYQQNRDICASTRGKADEAYLRAAVNLGSVQRMGGNDIKAEETLLSLLPDTGPNRQDRYWKKYTGRAADELVKLYKELVDTQTSRRLRNGSMAIQLLNGG
jgi:tetratricopeptide (TPR) repeat protein